MLDEKYKGILDPEHEIIACLFCRCPNFTSLGLKSKNLMRPKGSTSVFCVEDLWELVLVQIPIQSESTSDLERALLLLECNGDNRKLMAGVSINKDLVFSYTSNVFSISFCDEGEICCSQAIDDDDLINFHRVLLDVLSKTKETQHTCLSR